MTFTSSMSLPLLPNQMYCSLPIFWCLEQTPSKKKHSHTALLDHWTPYLTSVLHQKVADTQVSQQDCTRPPSHFNLRLWIAPLREGCSTQRIKSTLAPKAVHLLNSSPQLQSKNKNKNAQKRQKKTYGLAINTSSVPHSTLEPHKIFDNVIYSTHCTLHHIVCHKK